MRRLIVTALIAGSVLISSPAEATRSVPKMQTKCNPVVGCSLIMRRDCAYVGNADSMRYYCSPWRNWLHVHGSA